MGQWEKNDDEKNRTETVYTILPTWPHFNITHAKHRKQLCVHFSLLWVSFTLSFVVSYYIFSLSLSQILNYCFGCSHIFLRFDFLLQVLIEWVKNPWSTTKLLTKQKKKLISSREKKQKKRNKKKRKKWRVNKWSIRK